MVFFVENMLPIGPKAVAAGCVRMIEPFISMRHEQIVETLHYNLNLIRMAKGEPTLHHNTVAAIKRRLAKAPTDQLRILMQTVYIQAVKANHEARAEKVDASPVSE